MVKNNKAFLIVGIVMCLLSLLLLAGVVSFFAPCTPKEDGGWMACHWMGQALMGLACVMTVISLLLLVLPEPFRPGLAVSMIPLTVFTAAVPNGLMGSCMMETMRCNAVTKPAVTAVAVVLLILAVTETVLLRKGKSGKTGDRT